MVRAIHDKLELARKAGNPIVFIKDAVNEPQTKKEKFNNTFLEELSPLKKEIVILMRRPNAFSGTPLMDILTEKRINELVIVGAHTNTSVFFTAIEAKWRGFSVIILEDCVISDDKVAHAVFMNEMAKKHGIEVF